MRYMQCTTKLSKGGVMKQYFAFTIACFMAIFMNISTAYANASTTSVRRIVITQQASDWSQN